VIGVTLRPGTIMVVSLRMLYLIFGQLLSWLTLFGRPTPVEHSHRSRSMTIF
jgi:hypothetical protein